MQRAAESANARIVNQNVNAPERSHHLLGRRLDRLKTGHVADNDFGPSSSLRDRLRRRFEHVTSASAQNGDGAKVR